MSWRQIHRWLGLSAGTLALVLGLTGTLLAFDPLQQAWIARPPAPELDAATLVGRVARTVPGAQEIRRLPSGGIVVFGFDGDKALASYVDPADGRVIGAYQPSALPRWVKNLHRALLLGDAGRWGAAGVALAMALLSASGLVLLLRRMGGWRKLSGRVRGTLAQRLHVLTGRAVLVLLFLSSITALTMSAATLGLVALEPAREPEVASVVNGQAALAGAALGPLQSRPVKDLRRLSFPDAADPTDTWQLATSDGTGWIDRYSGQMLAWQDATLAQRINDWAVVLHTGEAAWVWAAVLMLVGASVGLFWWSGVIIWWQARRVAVHITGNGTLAQADTLIFVASEGGSTWGFAQTLHTALAGAGHRVPSAPLEAFRTTAATRLVFVLAATYGDGEPPTHARDALARIAALDAGSASVAVLGFGDRQFPAFCAYAQALDDLLRARGWPMLLALECIHQQSAQQFARWGEALAQALGEPLALRHVPRLPPTTELTLVSRRDYPGVDGQRAAILRFAWPAPGTLARWRGQGLGAFDAGDLIAIVPPGGGVPRYYSLASGASDGFVEICVRQIPGGLCSTHLLGLQPGESVAAFIRANPGFALPRAPRSVVLIGAGTGVAPLAGFIRRNRRRTPMHLYFGGRDPARDYYFGADIERWREQGKLASMHTAFSRISGGGYVQDALHRNADRLRELLAGGAIVRVCGSHAMARGVAEALDAVLAPLRLSVQQLKAEERYAEDLF
ncbi:MAG TPA: PepSY domain-containing protein [Burkholderiaceae bacterium]|nr:PepSY domain-containing protein [Burkholderiaceae bacterium]